LKQSSSTSPSTPLEAVKPGTGEVTIAIDQTDAIARLTISDNGRGMSPETLERIFEPFFTDKRGAQLAGTGLDSPFPTLSSRITAAIFALSATASAKAADSFSSSPSCAGRTGVPA